MRKLILLFALYLLHSLSFGQAHFDKIDYQKQLRSAIVNDIPFNAATVENAIEDTFSKMGYKHASSKEFTVYKGVRLAELGTNAYDIYFMIDKKSRKDKENSTVTIMLSKGFDDFMSQSSDAAIFDKAKTYLDSLRNMIAVYDLQQQITSQEEEVKRADKKNAGLQDESKDLAKKKRRLEEQIAGNIREQEIQVKEIEKQKQILETMKARRRS